KYERIEESDLHAFSGGEVILVDPGDISRYSDRPLDPEDSADRMRMIFGTKPLEWFPVLGENEEENSRLLRRYYEHLLDHLVLPFEATYINRRGAKVFSRCAFTVERLIDPDVSQAAHRDDLHESDVLYCSGTDADGNVLEVPFHKISCDRMPYKQFLDDYCTWLGDLAPLCNFMNWFE
ncbi:MAG: hypothetical protein LBI05_04640, partial [Planctomycetaceae bacterium]|nr:hypothetical protein [Planctomycetaceae bacterium]